MRSKFWTTILMLLMTGLFLLGLLIAASPYIYGTLVDNEINQEAVSFLSEQAGPVPSPEPSDIISPAESVPEHIPDTPNIPS